jgi:hypothetical protein
LLDTPRHTPVYKEFTYFVLFPYVPNNPAMIVELKRN